MQRADVLCFLILHYLISFSFGKIVLSVDNHSKVHVSRATNVSWTREDNDPVKFRIQKALFGMRITQQGATTVDSKGKNQGHVFLNFSFSGSHVLAALPVDADITSNFGTNSGPLFVSKPFSVHDLDTQASSTTVSPDSPKVSITTASPTNIPESIQSPDSGSKVAVIVASVTGALTGILLIITFVVLFMRRRRKLKLNPRPTFVRVQVDRSVDTEARGSFNDILQAYEDKRSSDPDAAFPLDRDMPTIHFVSLTDRQMDLQERILAWQSRLIGADNVTERDVRATIDSLKRLQGSDWAREMSDEVPAALL